MMTFLAVDHSHVHTDDGLYTGEEICTMFGENDCYSVGIEQVGFEMELDPEVLSSMGATSDEYDDQDYRLDEPQHDLFVIQGLDTSSTIITEKAVKPNGSPRSPAAVVGRPTAVVEIGNEKASKKSFSKRSIKGRFQVIKRQILTRASFKLNSIMFRRTHSFPPSSPGKALEATSSSAIKLLLSSDSNSTHAISLNSCSSSSTMDSNMECMQSPSSITTSTCDFPQEMNHQAVFESYLATNPWDAAKAGDYATLFYIANHDDANIWTQKDEYGNVPLYYACTSYHNSSQQHSNFNNNGMAGCSFGKYGLESINLLVNVWPSDVEFPKKLLKACSRSSGRNKRTMASSSSPILHKDVLEVLSRSNKGNENGKKKSLSRPSLLAIRAHPEEKTEIDGVSDIVPVSFLMDLGDDGYVEDY